MASYIPGSGFKKPLNQLENPIYPDIKQQPIRFVNSGKFWQVDVGRTLTESEHHPQFVENAVLFQSRDYNKTVYGQQSHRDYVNEEFRPPLLTQEDILPLCRLPRKIVVPRINPGSGETFNIKNEIPSGIDGRLTDRIKDAEWRPTFYCPIDVPEDNSILPDLELKLPNYSATAGFEIPFISRNNDGLNPKLCEKIDPKLDPGITTQIRFDGENATENIHLDHNRPQISAHSRENYTNLEFGVNSQVNSNIHLNNNMPSISAHSGINSFIEFPTGTQTSTDILLNENRPSVSVTSGIDVGNVRFGAYTQGRQDIPLETKIEPKYNVTNLSSEFEVVRNVSDPYGKKILNVRDPHSYSVPQVVQYKQQNENTAKPHFRLKQDSLGSYKGYDNRGFKPSFTNNCAPLSIFAKPRRFKI